jgi:hypothetical protein
MVDDSSLCQNRYNSSRTTTQGRCHGVVCRHRGYLPTIVVGIVLALLASSLSSSNAEGATTDKTVSGTAYDQTNNPLAGAQVTVEIWAGSWPDETVLRTSQSTVTDTWGDYEVTFAGNSWDPHNTIKVFATYDSLQGAHNVEANGDQYQTVDVTISTAIPEFSGPLGLLAMMAGCMVPIVVLLARRRR